MNKVQGTALKPLKFRGVLLGWWEWLFNCIGEGTRKEGLVLAVQLLFDIFRPDIRIPQNTFVIFVIIHLMFCVTVNINRFFEYKTQVWLFYCYLLLVYYLHILNIPVHSSWYSFEHTYKWGWVHGTRCKSRNEFLEVDNLNTYRTEGRYSVYAGNTIDHIFSLGGVTQKK